MRLSLGIIGAFLNILCTAFKAGIGCSDAAKDGECLPSSPSYTAKQEAARRLIDALLPLSRGKSDVALNGLDNDAKLLFGDVVFNGKDESNVPHNYEFHREEGLYVDRFVQGTVDVWSDPECMSGTLDASSPNFSAEDALRVFHKCRLVVIENFYSQDVLVEYKKKVTSYITGISSGRISTQGKTTLTGEPYYYAENAKRRFDVCFTDDMLHEEIMASDLLMKILMDEMVLDSDVQMLDFGVILSEPGAPLQNWHRDGGDYLFQSSYRSSGIGGHDLPPFAVAVISPLLNVTYSHGPTEFCMGSTNWVGVDDGKFSELPLKNETLREVFLNEYARYQVESDSDDHCKGCPARGW